jgi:[NiFe] hydrogenase diaphorase moiety small subunit
MAGGEDAAAVLVGGPSGTMIARDTFRPALTFDDLATGGAVVVFSASATSSRSSSITCPSSSMRAAATARPAGSATSSCRRPSRSSARASPTRIHRYLRDLSATIIETSRCGLGMTSPNPILSTLENFPLVYSAMVKPSEDGMRATFDIQSAIRRRAPSAKRRSYIFDKDFSAMSGSAHIVIDGVEITAKPARRSWRPPTPRDLHPAALRSRGAAPSGRLPGLHGQGNGRSVAACTQPAAPDLTVENETPHITKLRRDLVEMLFHEGNHLCPICEASGNCELQAMAYRLDMTEPTRFPIWSPAARSMPRIPTSRSTPTAASPAGAASAPRRMSMARASSAMSAGASTAVSVNGEDLAHTDAEITDFAVSAEVCPVGCIIRKRVGFSTPIGEREFDKGLIGSEIEGEGSDD